MNHYEYIVKHHERLIKGKKIYLPKHVYDSFITGTRNYRKELTGSEEATGPDTWRGYEVCVDNVMT